MTAQFAVIMKTFRGIAEQWKRLLDEHTRSVVAESGPWVQPVEANDELQHKKGSKVPRIGASGLKHVESLWMVRA